MCRASVCIRERFVALYKCDWELSTNEGCRAYSAHVRERDGQSILAVRSVIPDVSRSREQRKLLKILNQLPVMDIYI